MRNKKELEETIQKEYKDNKKFLEEQYKKVTDNNILMVLLENVNTIEGDDSFTELDLLETIIEIVNRHNVPNVDELLYYIKIYFSTWTFYNKEEKLRGLEHETN